MYNYKTIKIAAQTVIFLFLVNSLFSRVVINEIMYHPPKSYKDAEYVELYNCGNELIDISNWKFSDGSEYTFPDNTQMEPDEYIIIGKNKKILNKIYTIDVRVFEYKKLSLSNSGECITVLDTMNSAVDSVTYSDSDKWYLSPDGYSASLEKIYPTGDSNNPQYWSPSKLSKSYINPAGSPGLKNHNYTRVKPPLFNSVKHIPESVSLENPVQIELSLESNSSITKVLLHYSIFQQGSLAGKNEISMSYNKNNALYEATIPAVDKQSLIRYNIEVHSNDNIYYNPSPDDLCPAYSLYVNNFNDSDIPQGLIIGVDTPGLNALQRAQYDKSYGISSLAKKKRRNMVNELYSIPEIEDVWIYLSSLNSYNSSLFKQIHSEITKLHSKRISIIESVKNENSSDFSKLELNKIKEELDTLKKRYLSLDELQYFEDTVLRYRQSQMHSIVKQYGNLFGSWLYISTQLSLADEQLSKLHSVTIKYFSDFISISNTCFYSMYSDDKSIIIWEYYNAIEKLHKKYVKECKIIVPDQQYIKYSRWLAKNNVLHRDNPITNSNNFNYAFVYYDPQNKRTLVYDWVRVRERRGGYKVAFHKNNPLNMYNPEKQKHEAVSKLNLLCEFSPVFQITEPLAYSLYRECGVPAPLTEHIRLTIDNEPLGLHLMVEQVNKSFLRRNNRYDNGKLYKVDWFDQSNNKRRDYLTLAEQLSNSNKVSSKEEWEFIKSNFNIDEIINYYAVSLCIENWDGFYNNFYICKNKETGKRELYPWDNDSCWGKSPKNQTDTFFYDMPLTYGMRGDVPPGMTGFNEDFLQVWGRPDLPDWWRPGGDISGYILANKFVRKQLIKRINTILRTKFTKKNLYPIIDRYVMQLEKEILIRAEYTGDNPTLVSNEFNQSIDSIKQFIKMRKRYLHRSRDIIMHKIPFYISICIFLLLVISITLFLVRRRRRKSGYGKY